jgi:hypothetical protein
MDNFALITHSPLIQVLLKPIAYMRNNTCTFIIEEFDSNDG